MTTWVTLAEAGRRYGLSRTTLYRLIADGSVDRAKKTGDPKIYVSAEDLEEAISLRPTGGTWLPEWLRLSRHRAQAEEAFLRHLRDTSKKHDQQWLKRHKQLRQRLAEAQQAASAYLADTAKKWGEKA